MVKGGKKERALSHVVFGDTLTGSHGFGQPSRSNVASSGLRFGSDVQIQDGSGMSCRRGTSANATHNHSASRVFFVLISPRDDRVNHRPRERSNSGIVKNWSTASDRKPLLVPPPSNRQETIVTHESTRSQLKSCEANTADAGCRIFLLVDPRALLCGDIIAHASAGFPKFLS